VVGLDLLLQAGVCGGQADDRHLTEQANDQVDSFHLHPGYIATRATPADLVTHFQYTVGDRTG
jgi:hypothetical protein